ncbi:major facilitator superfamily transporter, partial [Achromobacter xylosoxidans C54]
RRAAAARRWGPIRPSSTWRWARPVRWRVISPAVSAIRRSSCPPRWRCCSAS